MERIPEIQAGYFGKEGLFSLSTEQQKKEKGGPKRKKRLLLDIFT